MSAEAGGKKKTTRPRKSAPRKSAKPRKAAESSADAAKSNPLADRAPDFVHPAVVPSPGDRSDDMARHLKTLFGLLVVWGSFYLVALAHQYSENSPARKAASDSATARTAGARK